MGACLKAKWVRIGLGLIVGGAAPLILIIAASKAGSGDPNPNPIGPGLLTLNGSRHVELFARRVALRQ